MARLGEPQLHHRNEAVPAGEQARVAVEASEQRHGFAEVRGAVIFEGTGDQVVLPSKAQEPVIADPPATEGRSVRRTINRG